jgi:hypothetical protein
MAKCFQLSEQLRKAPVCSDRVPGREIWAGNNTKVLYNESEILKM